MPNQPIVPRSITNPVGGSERIAKTVKAIDDALLSIEAWLVSRFNDIPVKEIAVNSLFVNKYRYEYQISIPDLETLVQEMLVQLGIIPDEYVIKQVTDAYEAGTGLAVTNLANISQDYTRNITSILLSEPYQRRVALIGARVFEDMKGFEGDLGVQLGRILRGAVQDGLNPRDVVGELKNRFDISARRAATIAQTEISGALRRGRWDEAQDAQEKLGIRLRLLWISALKPTTRLWHAQRHSLLYTVQEVREFYAASANSVNCYCTQVETLVDDNGKALTPKLIDRLEGQKLRYFGKSE